MQPAGPLHRCFSPYLAAVAAACLMGLLGVFVRNISFCGEVIAFARFALGFLFLICALFRRAHFRELTHHLSIYPVLSGVFLAFCALFYVKAIKLTSLANAAFLLYLGPLVAVIMSSFLLGERMNWINRLLVLSAFSGSALLIGLDLTSSKPVSLGNIYAAVSSILYALFIVMNRMAPAKISPTTRSFYQLLSAALVLVPFAYIGSGGVTRFYADVYWLVAMGFFQGFLSVTLMIFSIEYLKVFQFSTIVYLEPVVAAAAGALLYDEDMTLRQFLGGFMIVSSGIAQILFSTRSDMKVGN